MTAASSAITLTYVALNESSTIWQTYL
jgi:hypothetical protein